VITTSTESYFNQVFLLSYATTEVGVPARSMLLVTAICSAVTIGLVLTAARIADRIGNRTVFLVGIAGLALLAFPTFLVVNTGSFWGILGIRLVGTVFAAAVYAPIAAILATSFSVEVRYTGVSLGYQVAAILGGGFAPFIAQALLTATGTWTVVAGYFVVVCLISFVSMSLLGTAAKENADPVVRPRTAAA
jgi:MFS family permease